jgi:hypothetical protein
MSSKCIDCVGCFLSDFFKDLKGLGNPLFGLFNVSNSLQLNHFARPIPRKMNPWDEILPCRSLNQAS